MDIARFNQVVMDQIDQTQNTLVKKSAEYATDEDRLHNFKVAADLQGVSMREALAGMMAKHTVSVYDLCSDAGTMYTEAYIDEKIGDHINYLILLKAVLIDEMDSRPSKAVYPKQSKPTYPGPIAA